MGEQFGLAVARLLDLEDSSETLGGLWLLFHEEAGFHWQDLTYSERRPRQQLMLELSALLEALNWITGQGTVHRSARSDTTGNGDGPSLVYHWRREGGGGPRRQRFDKAETLLSSSLRRHTRTRWRYVYRLARGEIVSFEQMRAAISKQNDTALVAFHVTQHGTIVYLSRGTSAGEDGNGLMPKAPEKGALHVITLPALTLDYLRLVMQRRWVAPYRSHLAHIGQTDRAPSSARRFRETMIDTLEWFYRKLLRPVDDQLRRWGVKRVVFIPHRSLHLLPLHACWHMAGNQRRYLLDDYQISYLPSGTLGQICRERAAQRRTMRAWTAVSNPTGDLPFADHEVTQVAQMFNPGETRILSGDQAGLRALQAVPIASMFHFSGHGCYDWNSPLGSHLSLAGGDTLALGDLFDETIRLPDTELVVLSACETSITDPDDLADEYLGIASGFIFTGTSSVISTLWSVGDLSSSILIERFYRLHLDSGLSPEAALRQAQIWLRDMTAAELTHHLGRLRRQRGSGYENVSAAWRRFAAMDPRVKPYDHPYYWAAFTFTGA
jgi:CHAT domain-containing protein